MDKSNIGGLKKRQQIDKSNKMMFLWITGVSVVVGFSLVLILFLAQHIWYGERVLAEKQETASILADNLNVITELQNNVRLLNTNEDLKSVRLDTDDPAIQVILDALPADANATAMASSLQTKLLSGISGVSIESISIEAVDDVEDGDNSSDAVGINFSFIIRTEKNQDGLREILQRIERSIRPFTLDTFTIESQDGQVTMKANGRGYYLLAQQVELIEKVVKP